MEQLSNGGIIWGLTNFSGDFWTNNDKDAFGETSANRWSKSNLQKRESIAWITRIFANLFLQERVFPVAGEQKFPTLKNDAEAPPNGFSQTSYYNHISLGSFGVACGCLKDHKHVHVFLTTSPTGNKINNLWLFRLRRILWKKRGAKIATPFFNKQIHCSLLRKLHCFRVERVIWSTMYLKKHSDFTHDVIHLQWRSEFVVFDGALFQCSLLFRFAFAYRLTLPGCGVLI